MRNERSTPDAVRSPAITAWCQLGRAWQNSPPPGFPQNYTIGVRSGAVRALIRHFKRARMKITRVEPILVRTPLKLDDAQPHAGGVPKNDVHTVLVKVETDEGLVGWGEAFSNAGWQST